MRKLLITGAAVVILGGAVAGPMLLAGGSAAKQPAANPALPPATAVVTRTTLVETRTVAGTLSYGDLAPLSATGPGTLTWIAPVGSTVTRGEPLFKVDERPVVALYGSVPLYRTLSAGEDDASLAALRREVASKQVALSDAQQALDDLKQTAAENASQAQLALAEAQQALDDAQKNRDKMNYPHTTNELVIEKAQTDYLLAKQAYKEALKEYNKVDQKRLTNPERVQALSRLVTAEQDMNTKFAIYNWYQLGYTDEDIAQADAELAVATADLEAAQADWDNLKNGTTQAEIALAEAEVAVAEQELKRAQAVLEGAASRASPRADIQQLQENLAELGYTGFAVDGTYTSATAEAVRTWQADLGLPATGTVEPGQVVFTPGAVRIAEHTARVGDVLSGGGVSLLSYTGTTRLVTVELDVADQALAVEERKVTVTVPGREAVEGEISLVGTVVTAQSTDVPVTDARSEVTVTIADQAALGSLDAAPVDVDFVSEERTDVLAVPVAALLALSDGGYGVEIVEGDTTHIVAVNTGMFAAGWVEVSGKGIAEGVTVGVPK